MQLEDVWPVAIDCVTHRCDGKLRNRPNHDDIQKIIGLLREYELFEFFENLVFENFRSDLQSRVIPEFRSHVLSNGASDLVGAVQNLHKNVEWYFYLVPVWPCADEFALRMREIFISCLYWVLDDKMKNVFSEFYSYAFQICTWKSEQEKQEDVSMEEDVTGDEDECITLEWDTKSMKMKKSECDDFFQNKFLPMTTKYLFDLDLLGVFAELPVSRVLEVEIKRYVERTCKGEYEKCCIHTLLKEWVETVVMNWLETIFGKMWERSEPSTRFKYGLPMTDNDLQTSEGRGHSRRQWSQKLLFILYETYTEMRIGEMFRIITDFPDSYPAIEDLKICLERTNQRPFLIKTVRKDLSSRVLHPGVGTSDIIMMYISAVKALRLLDPSGVVMDIVLEPYTKYLTERNDAVRMIMTELLDDDKDGNELAMELARGATEPGQTGPVHGKNPGREEIPKNPDDWVPDPREADPEKADKSRRTTDIISLLVGMYGSTNRFIKEYQKLLSRRLYSNWCAGTSEESEIKNFELLKLRFGEEDMGSCAVMLKDVADSKRVNSYIHDEYAKKNDVKTDIDVSTLIVSSEYWPELPTHDLTLPPVAQDSFDKFVKGYEAHKASRSLRWISSVGRVDLELELKDRTLQMQVTPLLACVITLFQDKDTWTLSEISSEVKVPITTLKRKIAFWLQQGVLRETETDTYTVIEEQPGGSFFPQSSKSAGTGLEDLSEVEEAEEDAPPDSGKTELKEQLIWKYIKGMLNNIESLPLDRIHKMLRMFAVHDPGMQMDTSKLRTFLNKKAQEGLIAMEAGKYKLKKS